MVKAITFKCITCNKYTMGSEKVNSLKLVSKVGRFYFHKPTKDYWFYCPFCEHLKSINLNLSTTGN